MPANSKEIQPVFASIPFAFLVVQFQWAYRFSFVQRTLHVVWVLSFAFLFLSFIGHRSKQRWSKTEGPDALSPGLVWHNPPGLFPHLCVVPDTARGDRPF